MARLDWNLDARDTATIFYDSTENNDNFNYKSSNYSGLNNYEIKVGLFANVYGTNDFGSGNTDYLAISPDLIIKDYDEPTTFTNTIKTYHDITLVDLGGAIRTDGDTIFEITWVKDTAFTDLSAVWAIHRIEPENNTSDEIYELSIRNKFRLY